MYIFGVMFRNFIAFPFVVKPIWCTQRQYLIYWSFSRIQLRQNGQNHIVCIATLETVASTHCTQKKSLNDYLSPVPKWAAVLQYSQPIVPILQRFQKWLLLHRTISMTFEQPSHQLGPRRIRLSVHELQRDESKIDSVLPPPPADVGSRRSVVQRRQGWCVLCVEGSDKESIVVCFIKNPSSWAKEISVVVLPLTVYHREGDFNRWCSSVPSRSWACCMVLVIITMLFQCSFLVNDRLVSQLQHTKNKHPFPNNSCTLSYCRWRYWV